MTSKRKGRCVAERVGLPTIGFPAVTTAVKNSRLNGLFMMFVGGKNQPLTPPAVLVRGRKITYNSRSWGGGVVVFAKDCSERESANTICCWVWVWTIRRSSRWYLETVIGSECVGVELIRRVCDYDENIYQTGESEYQWSGPPSSSSRPSSGSTMIAYFFTWGRCTAFDSSVYKE